MFPQKKLRGDVSKPLKIQNHVTQANERKCFKVFYPPPAPLILSLLILYKIFPFTF